MSKKSQIMFICQECGTAHSKWNGKCEGCGEWNTLVEESNFSTPVFGKGVKHSTKSKVKAIEIHDLDSKVDDVFRFSTHISEMDRVLGGGIVSGSAILLGGDPGIGKSTLLLQTVITLTQNGTKCLYISGEESVEQIKLRSRRLSNKPTNTQIAAATSLNEIIKAINTNDFSVLIIDSIQTIFNDAIESAPGSVSQVRACAFELIRIAKAKNICLILVGHVTKEGSIAGPKVLEHMVDTVLYFEGERGHQFRIIRAVKNRFGPANEIGVFEMGDDGLTEVTNPSSIFLQTKDESIPGSAIYVGLEGTRPILLEIQALVVPSFLATPRRAVVGWDSNRLAMMIAVLNARYGINLLDKEVYLNVVGGLKITEPAADLAVMAALISAFKNKAINRQNVFVGEVGLSGELRQVPHYNVRLSEAQKLGFGTVYAPQPQKNKKLSCDIEVVNINHIRDLEKIL